jgi:hypothetical protein
VKCCGSIEELRPGWDWLRKTHRVLGYYFSQQVQWLLLDRTEMRMYAGSENVGPDGNQKTEYSIAVASHEREPVVGRGAELQHVGLGGNVGQSANTTQIHEFQTTDQEHCKAKSR